MKRVTFNDGNSIPMVGFGVFTIPAGRTGRCTRSPERSAANTPSPPREMNTR